MVELQPSKGITPFVILLGRMFYSFIFIFASLQHFTKPLMDYAASHGVPMVGFLVPFSGVIAFLGGLSILLGYKGRWGAFLLVVFLVPVTLVMHNFWAVSDPASRQIQTIMFMKNLSMLGAALIILSFGTGALSLDKAGNGKRSRISRGSD